MCYLGLLNWFLSEDTNTNNANANKLGNCYTSRFLKTVKIHTPLVQ